MQRVQRATLLPVSRDGEGAGHRNAVSPLQPRFSGPFTLPSGQFLRATAYILQAITALWQTDRRHTVTYCIKGATDSTVGQKTFVITRMFASHRNVEISSTTIKSYLIETRKMMNDNYNVWARCVTSSQW